jgi:hypothetical protein
LNRVEELIAMSQTTIGLINTAYVERLKATLRCAQGGLFHARLPSLARRTRSLARTAERLEAEVFWVGAIYNSCTVHDGLNATPAMAAGLAEHAWPVEELLWCKSSSKPLHAVLYSQHSYQRLSSPL